MPFEALNNMRYIRKAKDVLDKLSAIKIGITGSFGKTSCKHILTEMLSIKYKVIKTTKSYNTPLGICYSTLEVKGDEEIFIAEMGARNKGDVSKLCELVKPTYGIITGIGNQHYESFKTHQAIYDTKKELVDAIPPQGYVVFNGENKKACAMSCQCKSETAVVHMTKKEGIYAQNVKLTNAGSSFEIVGLGKPMAVTTRLLGRHNIINILMCAALAYRLGLTSRDIASAISKLSPVKHRLALVENSSLITIIDDSYNANFEGVGFALEVLSQFKGRKVVFTQGIVELGKLQVETNMMLGTMLANVADIVLLCGENSKAINNGLENARFQGEVYNCKSIEDAKTHFSSILKANDTLLIQNDIP
jgi:UDP-N-acetylmuramoyl-tripeptide--D-alanyl-D-alanine ligase